MLCKVFLRVHQGNVRSECRCLSDKAPLLRGITRNTSIRRKAVDGASVLVVSCPSFHGLLNFPRFESHCALRAKRAILAFFRNICELDRVRSLLLRATHALQPFGANPLNEYTLSLHETASSIALGILQRQSVRIICGS